jgi:bifunctional non-homologous end joining protein LigD
VPAKKKPGDLREYRTRRRFDVTPEPSGRGRPRKKGQSFVVHKHDASTLHYDLRLEIGGVLASWAVPKGPSYDAGSKRLAVQTEDHPLEYARFEGQIPEGQYGAGDSIIWDRGTFDTNPPGMAREQLAKGHLDVELRGRKLKGRWHLVHTRLRGGERNWLLFKAKDELEDASYDVLTKHPESVVSGREVGELHAGA